MLIWLVSVLIVIDCECLVVNGICILNFFILRFKIDFLRGVECKSCMIVRSDVKNFVFYIWYS